MGPAFYIMAILGCGEADAACEPVATVATRYESAAECNAATEAEIARHSDVLFPVVVAQCRSAARPTAQTVFADDVKRPGDEEGQKVRRASYPQLRLARR